MGSFFDFQGRMQAPSALRRTRYFVFTRINPSIAEYSHLVKVCEDINASLGYKTVQDGEKLRLVGFLVLRGPSTVSGAIGRLLPNFIVSPLHFLFNDGFHWLHTIPVGVIVTKKRRYPDGPMTLGTVFFNGKAHPFDDLKRSLFLNE